MRVNLDLAIGTYLAVHQLACSIVDLQDFNGCSLLKSYFKYLMKWIRGEIEIGVD